MEFMKNARKIHIIDGHAYANYFSKAYIVSDRKMPKKKKKKKERKKKEKKKNIPVRFPDKTPLKLTKYTPPKKKKKKKK